MWVIRFMRIPSDAEKTIIDSHRRPSVYASSAVFVGDTSPNPTVVIVAIAKWIDHKYCVLR